jgi:hypothetical protein
MVATAWRNKQVDSITLLVYNVLVVGLMTSSYLFSKRTIIFSPDVDKVCDALYRRLCKWIFTSEKLSSKFQEDMSVKLKNVKQIYWNLKYSCVGVFQALTWRYYETRSLYTSSYNTYLLTYVWS